MSDETNLATTDDPALLPGTAEQRAEEDLHGMSAISSSDLPMLPGELRPHPSPFQYVMIAVILCVITALEVGMYYLTSTFLAGSTSRSCCRWRSPSSLSS